MRVYTEEYKIESVRQYVKNGRGLTFTARELGVPNTTLNGWVKKYMSQIISANKKEKPLKKDYESLLKEKDKYIQTLEEEVAILKKSIGIFTRNPQQK
jgi:transposase